MLFLYLLDEFPSCISSFPHKHLMSIYLDLLKKISCPGFSDVILSLFKKSLLIPMWKDPTYAKALTIEIFNSPEHFYFLFKQLFFEFDCVDFYSIFSEMLPALFDSLITINSPDLIYLVKIIELFLDNLY